MFDITSKAGWDGVAAWAPFIKTYDPEIQIVVGNHTSAASTDAKASTKTDTDTDTETATEPATASSCPLRETASKWCLDVGPEFVEVLYQDRVVTEPDEEQDLGAEQQGTARVKEALESNMWEHMTRAERAPAPQIDFSSMIEDIKNQEASSTSQTDSSATSSAAPPDEKQKAQDDAEDMTDAQVAELMAHDEKLQAMIQRVRQVRSDASSLSDQERRARAAETAMRLMEEFGFGDSDSES